MKWILWLCALLTSGSIVCAQTSPQQPPPSNITPATLAKAGTPARLSSNLLEEKKQPRQLPQFDKPPLIDGRLDDEVWQQSLSLKDFYQVYPEDNISASKPTEVLLGYDSTSLYIAFRAYDEPGKVRATIAKRDSIFNDDYVGCFLDTFNDKRKAYELFFNPLGVQQDGLLTEGQGEDFSVDIVMTSKGVLTEQGYSVEVAIPFRSLRYEAGEGKLWGIHFFRRIKRLNDELDSWMPLQREQSGVLAATGHITEAKSGALNQAGHITGFKNIWTGRTLELIPSFTASETGKRVRTLVSPPVSAADGFPSFVNGSRLLNEPVKFEPGLTAKMVLTPGVTIDLALNPDFAQVETDQVVVTANQRFPIFFEEKRPFFLEGIDVFQTPLIPLHTRAIIDPDIAVKVTGKRGRNTFGALVASDNAPGNFSEEERNDPALLTGIQRFLDKNAYIGVVRFKHDIGSESNLGLMATGYSFIEKHNFVGGFDGRVRLSPQKVIDFQVLGTTSRNFFFDPDQDKRLYRTGNGLGYHITYSQTGEHLTYTFRGEGRTKDYRANVGFTRRANFNLERFIVSYKSDSDQKARLISWAGQFNSHVAFDFQGRFVRWELFPNFTLNFQRQTSLNVFALVGSERLYEDEFGARRTATRPGFFFGAPERQAYYKAVEAVLTTTPSEKFSFSVDAFYKWDTFDLDLGNGFRFPRVSPAALADPDAPLDPGPGGESYLNLSLAYQPTSALRTTFEMTKNMLVRNDNGLKAFDTNLFTSRTTYQFTRFLFARARLDYDTLNANMHGQFLFGWTPNPGTSLYVGYNDDLNYNGLNEFVGRVEPGFLRNRRTFFVKMSYLFRRNL
jgi:hypothetical protein